MAEQLSREERLKLIHQNLQEVLKPEIIEQIVLKEDRPLKIYWGMATIDSNAIIDCLRHCDHWPVGSTITLREYDL